MAAVSECSNGGARIRGVFSATEERGSGAFFSAMEERGSGAFFEPRMNTDLHG